MADTKKDVEINITGKADGYKKTIKEVNQLNQTFNKEQQKTFKDQQKQRKVISDSEKKSNNRGRANQDIQQLRRQAAELKKANLALREQSKELDAARRQWEKFARIADKYAHGGKRMIPDGPGGGGGGGEGGNNGRDRRSGPSRLSRLGGFLLQGAGTITGAISSAMTRGYDEYVNYGRALSPFIAQRQGRSALNENALRAGQAYGFTMTESAQQAIGAARATGTGNSVLAAQAAARLGMMDVGETTNMMGLLTRSGESFKQGKHAERILYGIMRDATTAGLDQSRTGEHFDAVASVIQGSHGAGINANATQISALFGQIGRLGEGFRGERGAGFLSKIDQAIKGGGGGEAGRSFIQQALGFGRPTGGASFYETERRREQGIFGRRGAQNFADLLRYAEASSGGDDQVTNLTLRELTGTTLEQIEEFRNAFSGGGIDALEKKIQEAAPPTDNMQEAAKGLIESNRELSKVVRDLADFANRNVEIGRRQYDATISLQRAGQDLMDAVLPDIQKAFAEFAHIVVPELKAAAPLLKTAMQGTVDLVQGLSETYHKFFPEEQTTDQRAVAYNTSRDILGRGNDYRRIRDIIKDVDDEDREAAAQDLLLDRSGIAADNDDSVADRLASLTPEQLTALRTRIHDQGNQMNSVLSSPTAERFDPQFKTAMQEMSSAASLLFQTITRELAGRQVSNDRPTVNVQNTGN